MAALLATLLKLVLTAGLVFVCFGFHYTETLLRLLLAGRGGASSAVSEVAPVLSWYCVYVLFLAANGMCEAFACSVAGGGELTGMGGGLVASFLAFWALVGPLMKRFGTRGLVMANAAGMACRVACSAAFIRRYFLHGTRRGFPRSAAGEPAGGTGDGPRDGPRDTPPRAGEEHGASDRADEGDGRRHGEGRRSLSRGGETKRHGVVMAVVHEEASAPNLWRGIVSASSPHPVVVVTMALSSLAAYVTSPYRAGAVEAAAAGSSSGNAAVPGWDVVAAAKHVGVGAAGLAVTAVSFAALERAFLREMGALLGARRRLRSGGGVKGAGTPSRAAAADTSGSRRAAAVRSAAGRKPTKTD